jgi:tRNA uracil 4-sulfurtransferase
MEYLVKLGEIILKGKNRYLFEKRLKTNIKLKLGEKLKKLTNFGGVYSLEAKEDVLEDLKNVFGIKKIAPVQIFQNLEDLISELKSYKPQKFYLDVKRGTKDYPLNSLEIKNKIVYELERLGFLKTDNKKEATYFWKVEYRNKKFYLVKEEYDGLGGLPVGSSGKGLALISCGFDSPVASFLLMKRGLKIYFLHFHSYPQTTKEALEAVEKLVKILNQYNLQSFLFLINILDLQKFYFQNMPKEHLVIFYRRSMIRIAERLAKSLNIKALITGDNLGQVASQTLENLNVISEATNLLVLRPLLGFDKDEIIELSQKIGTYEISSKGFEDCCSLFLPKKVKTKAHLEEVKKWEKKFEKEIEELEEKAIENKELRKIW